MTEPMIPALKQVLAFKVGEEAAGVAERAMQDCFSGGAKGRKVSWRMLGCFISVAFFKEVGMGEELIEAVLHSLDGTVQSLAAPT